MRIIDADRLKEEIIKVRGIGRRVYDEIIDLIDVQKEYSVNKWIDASIEVPREEKE